MNEDHIVIDMNTGKFKCEICGEEASPPIMPVPIDTLIEAMDHFTSQHKACKPSAEAVMSEYIRGFNSGFEYVIHEVENYITKANSHDAMVLVQLLSHLKMEDNSKKVQI